MILSASTERTVLAFKKLLSYRLLCNISLYLPSNTFIPNDLSLYSVEVSYTTTTIPSGIVPDYATGCADCKAYAKACSCWHITSTVTTAATPTTTVILNVTEYSPCGTTIPLDPFRCTKPGVCGSLNYIEDDRCGDEGLCACSYNLSGSAVCVEDVDCDAADTCGDDFDCEGDLICWRYSCCDTRVCTNLSEVCADPDLARLGFHGGQKALLPTERIGEI
jgi:hypothetical protein